MYSIIMEKIIKRCTARIYFRSLLFHVFINDIFYFILKSTLYNYADDNTLSYIHKDLEILKSVLEEESIILIKWFEENYMQANTDKFQATLYMCW